MTGYTAIAEDTQGISIQPVTFEIKIIKADVMSNASQPTRVQVYRQTGSVSSSVPIVASKEGAPAASAKAKDSSSASGQLMSESFLAKGTTWTYDGGYSYPGVTASIESPLTLTFAPGSVFAIVSSSVDVSIVVYLEEIRLLGSY